jgi:hypothetical protein
MVFDERRTNDEEGWTCTIRILAENEDKSGDVSLRWEWFGVGSTRQIGQSKANIPTNNITPIITRKYDHTPNKSPSLISI